MEQQLAAGLREGQIAGFIQDQEIETGYQIGCPALAFCAGFSIQFVYEINDVEEVASPPFSDICLGNAGGEMAFKMLL